MQQVDQACENTTSTYGMDVQQDRVCITRLFFRDGVAVGQLTVSGQPSIFARHPAMLGAPGAGA